MKNEWLGIVVWAVVMVVVIVALGNRADRYRTCTEALAAVHAVYAERGPEGDPLYEYRISQAEGAVPEGCA